jgi:hypothetical protein
VDRRYRRQSSEDSPSSGRERNRLARVFRGHLNAPLLSTLKPRATSLHTLGLVSSRPYGFPLETLSDLLRHPYPPLPLIRAVKEFAKGADSAAVDPLPPEVATALYFTMIAISVICYGSPFTRLDDIDLRDGLQWTAQQSWIDIPIRMFARKALNSLGS